MAHQTGVHLHKLLEDILLEASTNSFPPNQQWVVLVEGDDPTTVAQHLM